MSRGTRNKTTMLVHHGSWGAALHITKQNNSSAEKSGKSVSLSHNHATKSPSVTIGRPKYTTPSNTPIPRSIPLTISNGIRIQSAVLPQYTFQTDRLTDRWDR